MNKTNLVDAVAAKSGMSKANAKVAVEAVLESISGALAEGDKVVLIGFGTFSVAEKPARKGINPRTKEKITIKARKNVKFKAGATLEEKVK